MNDLFDFKDPPIPAPPPKSQSKVQAPALRPDGQYACALCGAPAHFGFGVKLLEGRLGRWACHAHRDAVKNTAPR